MRDPDCEKYVMAAMDLLPGIAEAELAEHLASCTACREEVPRQREIALQLESFAAQEFTMDLWPELEKRITRQPSSWVYVAAGVFLAGCKFLDLASGERFAVLQLLAGLIVAWLLYAKRDSLLRIEELRIEGELHV